MADPLSVRCTYCGALPAERCRLRRYHPCDGSRYTLPHAARIRAAEGALAEKKREER